MPLKVRPGERSGLTIMELVVAMSILLMLSVAFAMIFSQARSSTEGGAERIAIRANHRIAQKRLSILLRSAMAPNEVDPAVVEPAYNESSSRLRFHAPADLLDSSQAFDPRTPDYPEFEIVLDSASGGLRVRRSNGAGPSQLIGRDFDSLTFDRQMKGLVTVEIGSSQLVRGAAGKPKNIEESSLNSVQLPGLR